MSKENFSRARLAALLLVVGACSGDSAFLPPKSSGIAINPSSGNLSVGDTLRLTATAADDRGFPQTGVKFTWSSAATSIVTVDTAGLVRAVAPGTTTVSATTDVRTAKITITVSAPVAKIPYTTVSVGGLSACGLTAANAVLCWGANTKGELGNGTVTDRNVPVPATVASATTVSAGDAHACAIVTAGTYCWGANDFRQLGLGSAQDSAFRTVPQRVLTSFVFTQVSAGGGHTCALTFAGDAFCWGDGQFGQLGNGQSAPGLAAIAPVFVTGGHKFTQISAGQSHTCAIGENSAVFCWGKNDFGQLGTGQTVNRNVPTALAAPLAFTSVSAGSTHTCAVASDQSIYCWGFGSVGQLGNNRTQTTALPAQAVSTQKFVTVSAGFLHTCARTTAGAAYCWGSNANGQLGEGSGTNQLTPVPVSGTLNFATIGAGTTFSCGVTVDRIAYCWGGNTRGELGIGTAAGSVGPARVSGS